MKLLSANTFPVQNKPYFAGLAILIHFFVSFECFEIAYTNLFLNAGQYDVGTPIPVIVESKMTNYPFLNNSPP